MLRTDCLASKAGKEMDLIIYCEEKRKDATSLDRSTVCSMKANVCRHAVCS